MQPIVTDRVAWSVCRSVTLVSAAKTAAPIEMPFGSRTWVRSPMGRGNFEGGKSHLIVKYRDTLWSSVQKRLNRLDAVWVMGSDGP